MGFFAIVWTTVAVIGVILVVAIGAWVRRLDAEDFPQGSSTLTDEERRAAQLGIGLGGNSGMGGH